MEMECYEPNAAAALVLGDLAQLFGEKFTEVFVIPHLQALCEDENWGVRKSVCEIYVKISENASKEVRQQALAPRFVKMLQDPSRWVSYVAYQELGPFIATFANSTMTGLALRDGQIYERTDDLIGDSMMQTGGNGTMTGTESEEGNLNADRNDCERARSREEEEFGTLPADCWMPLDDEANMTGSDRHNSSYSAVDIDERRLNEYLDEWYGQKPTSTQSAPASVMNDEDEVLSRNRPIDSTASIAAKCNSSEDLSKLGLDEDNVLDKTIYEDDEEDMDVCDDRETEQNTVTEDEVMQDGEGESLKKDEEGMDGVKMEEETRDVKKEQAALDMEENFVETNYWASENPPISIDDDDLIPFGCSTSSPRVISFLQDRLDALTVSPTSSANNSSLLSPLSSPRRSQDDSLTDDKTSSVIASTDLSSHSTNDTLCIFGGRRSMDMDIDEDSELLPDCREAPLEDTNMEHLPDGDEEIVPAALVDQFMSMGMSTSLCADTDILRHCAHNFPAVAFTLGRAKWPQLKETYHRLAGDDQWRVRASLANSMHEIALIVGSPSTAADLLPVFNSFREDVPEVRMGILKHLYEFFKCLPSETRNAMVDVLPQFMPVDNTFTWRFRQEFARQCIKLCELYGIEEINRTMSAIGLTLANDRIAEVRKDAILLLSQILYRLVDHEWKTLEESKESSDARPIAILSEMFVADLVNGFAKTQKWNRRQTFALLCAQVLRDKTLTIQQFDFFLRTPLLSLIKDKVANVRIAVGEAFGLYAQTQREQNESGRTEGEDTDALNAVQEQLMTLTRDADMDVSRKAREALGLTTNEKEFIDISTRGDRLQQKEEAVLHAMLTKDNTLVMDMSIDD
ncbi:hypothetical protein WR25_01847 isoform B [Diploscapter pachys]|uniref:TOG domain-containing protein n=1 Tax=Diploscapter pachys TaxID=2018661 RepID=A0A2A2JD03_9BILA|nr:hypothetical protein WR25_01847 isoform B [Diploscapter pachys]